jgi:polyhydroxyalkanoate synthesis regulator phasin
MAEERIRRGLFTGLGLVLLSRDRIRETVHRVADETDLRRKDADRLIEALCSRGEERWTALEERAGRFLRDRLKALDLARESDLKALRKQVANLEKRLAVMESVQSRERGPS